MTGQSCMVYFNIHFEIFVEAMSFQEADYSFRIYIILVFSGLHRFRFDQESTFETTGTSIVTSDSQHLCQVFFFTFLICVQKRHIAFTTTPEYIVLTTQFDSCVDCILDLNSSTSYYVKIRISSSTVHITCMTKYIGSTPQQFDACFSLFLFCISYNFFQIGLIFFNACTFRNQIHIVETVIFDTDFLHEFETCIHFIFCSLNSVCVTVPRELFCSATELVTAFSTQCMPPCHREFQPVFHLLSIDYFLCIIIAECHRIFAILTFKLNLFNSRKKLFCCHN